jgi:hypothetical protein
MRPVEVDESGALSRRTVIALSVVVGLLLVSGAGALYLRKAPREVTVDDALATFRASASAPSPSSTAPGDDGGVAGVGAPAAGPSPAAPQPAGAVASATPTGSGSPAAPSPTLGATRAGGGGPGSAPVAQPQAATDSGASPTARAEIEDGVYAYATEGYESTNALGGARHDYPKETPVTVRKADCGFTQRWQPLQERWDESHLCRSDASFDIATFTTFHEFFQRSQEQQFTCPAGSSVYRTNAKAGETWGWRCTAAGSAIETIVTVVGTETLDIGGRAVPTVRIKYDSKLSGANRGTQLQERWLHAESGLNVRIKTDIDTEADSPFGAVHYEEHYTITATSLTPRR